METADAIQSAIRDSHEELNSPEKKEEAFAQSLEDVTADVALVVPAAPQVLGPFPSPASPGHLLFESDDENELVLVSDQRTLLADAANDDELALKRALAASLEDK